MTTMFDTALIQQTLGNALAHAEDGELFMESRRTEALSFDDGRLKNASDDSTTGFGLRGMQGENTAYAHSSDCSAEALQRAAQTVQAALSAGVDTQQSVAPAAGAVQRYAAINPLQTPSFAKKIDVLQQVDTYLRQKDPCVVQVSCSLITALQNITIARADGFLAHDVRPLVRFNVNVEVQRNGRRESGNYGCGGRVSLDTFLTPQRIEHAANEALRQAMVNLDAIDAPAGEMMVLLGAGWPGVLLHEAVGHGLEGDFNRKGVSAFAGLMGQRVAAKGVTVIDDGTLMDRRGSLTIDDEGTPTQRTPLIEDGILVGYLQDRLNARLMNVAPTGNGRRESYAHMPMPRMTNTFMDAGTDDHDQMLASIKNGIYAPNFGGGQVDITSGRFVFTCTEAYKVENGKIVAPLKGATLIGCGPTSLHDVIGVGNNLKLDDGIGTCGKAGQGVPVGVGQPSVLLSKMTVGGTAAA